MQQFLQKRGIFCHFPNSKSQNTKICVEEGNFHYSKSKNTKICMEEGNFPEIFTTQNHRGEFLLHFTNSKYHNTKICVEQANFPCIFLTQIHKTQRFLKKRSILLSFSQLKISEHKHQCRRGEFSIHFHNSKSYNAQIFVEYWNFTDIFKTLNILLKICVEEGNFSDIFPTQNLRTHRFLKKWGIFLTFSQLKIRVHKDFCRRSEFS